MTKVRVHELARELNVESKVLLAKLKSSGAKIASHQSTLTDQQVNDLRSAFGAAPAAASAAAGASAAASGDGKPKVIVRRRAASAEPTLEKPAAQSPAEELRQAATAEPEPKEQAPEPTPAPAARAPEPEPVHEEPEAVPEVEEEKPVVAAKPAAVAEARVPEAAPQTSATVVRPAATPVPPPKPAAPAREEQALAPPVARAPQPPSAPAPAPAPRAPQPPSAPAAVAAGEPAAAAAPVRRREVGGATIVRRATPEEIEKLSQDRRNTGRKEDHRGTRVTGMGLLQNRVSADQGGAAQARAGGPQGQAAGAGAPGAAPFSGEHDWGDRPRVGERKKTAAEEAEEAARKKAAAKNRRSNSPISTRALLQQAQEIFGSGEDEDTTAAAESAAARTVYTPMTPRTRRDVRRRKDLKKTQITTPRASYRIVEMGESITVGELARQLAVKSSEIIKKLMAQGVMATINQPIDFDTATIMAGEYGFETKSNVVTDEDVLRRASGEQGEAQPRPPIVTIMGHVDHGKTSILDAIRAANVAAGEAGGITQHIGAYSVDHDGETITFLDTPGHEAFSAMRARGAKVTDIVILVVAADDGVMPQTVEAISHAKAAGVPIIVAVNKIDKPNVNFERIYTELTEHGIQAEEWGGDAQFIKVSALKRIGIEDLLEAVLLQAEVLELTAPTDGAAEGAVIEAHLDKGRGPVATVIVQRGTLKPGDYIVAGTEYGRVRAMNDHKGREVKGATPALPVEILGLSGVPMAGDQFNVVADEKTAREVSSIRLEKARQAAATRSSAASLADLLNKVKLSEVPEVPFILKADTQGSAEAVSESILKVSTDKVRNRIIHSAVGGVTESDITLASATGAIIIAFNVRAPRGLEEMAEKQGVVIRYFSIIYEIVDAVKAVMVGKLPPIVSEVVTGRAEVRKPISVPKIGTIAGSAVIDGKIPRGAYCRLIRADVVIYTGKLGSLRRFKDDVKEVVQGYECGIGIDGYNDVREGDVIEAYVLEETAATL